jgi:AraC-like DNA-binding protein
MSSMTRAPKASLRPFVRLLWVSDRLDAPAAPGAREHAVPTGEMHLVVRTSDAPARLFADDEDRDGRTFGHALVAGPRDAFHVKDVSDPFYAIGVQLHPAASLALFGAPADELTGRHIGLDDVWGREAAALRARLAEAGDPARQLDVLEAALAARLPRVQGVHPAVAMALERFHTARASGVEVGAVVKESGYSHRGLLAMFRRTMGLTPKRYLRVLRMQRVLRRIGLAPWADIALDAGFSDQSHFVREFRDITGVTPTDYVRRRSPHRNHVPVAGSERTRPTRNNSA